MVSWSVENRTELWEGFSGNEPGPTAPYISKAGNRGRSWRKGESKRLRQRDSYNLECVPSQKGEFPVWPQSQIATRLASVISCFLGDFPVFNRS